MTSNFHNSRRLILSHGSDWPCGSDMRHGARVLAALLVMLSLGSVSGQEIARGPGTLTPGARRAAPSAGVRDRRIPESAVSYVGIMGAVKNRGVYSSPEASIALSDLVERAGGLADGATRMAHVIRDGRAGLRVFFTPDTSERLLPGDVVVFQGGGDGQPHLSGNARGTSVGGPNRTKGTAPVPDTVHVAFLGLLDRQPIIVPLDGRDATVPHVVHDLRQSPAVVKTVRVIRTDRRSHPARTGRLPGRLADGDVLVFDRGAIEMDATALARTQTTAATRFPPAIPMLPEPSAESLVDGRFVDDSFAAAASPLRVGSESQPDADSRIASDRHEPNGRVPSWDLGSIGTPDTSASPTRELPIVSPASAPTDSTAVSTTVSTAESPAESLTGSREGSSENPQHAVVAGGAAETDRSAAESLSTSDARPGHVTAAGVAATDLGAADVTDTAEVPFLDLAPAVEHAKLASLVDPSDVDFEKFLGKAASTHFEPAAAMPLALPLASSVPKPRDPSPASEEPEERGSLAALDTPTIVIGVLALAALCFAVSIAWTRIDRTAETLEEPPHEGRVETAHAPSHRQVLERLINNELPMIEEPAQLPDRMDYHGEELGRRRLMLDDPHELMGPHFVVEPDVVTEPDVAGTEIAATKSVAPAAGGTMTGGMAAGRTMTGGAATGGTATGGTATGPAKAAAAEAPLSPPERARAALSRFAIASEDTSASADSMRLDNPVEPAGDSASDQQTIGSEATNDSESSEADARQSAGHQPHSRLLERVLIAMERERRG